MGIFTTVLLALGLIGFLAVIARNSWKDIQVSAAGLKAHIVQQGALKQPKYETVTSEQLDETLRIVTSMTLELDGLKKKIAGFEADADLRNQYLKSLLSLYHKSTRSPFDSGFAMQFGHSKTVKRFEMPFDIENFKDYTNEYIDSNAHGVSGRHGTAHVVFTGEEGNKIVFNPLMSESLPTKEEF